jgi:hypothetical protein
LHTHCKTGGGGVRVFLKMGYGKCGWVMAKGKETKDMGR